jgi:prephenate dehydrogenase
MKIAIIGAGGKMGRWLTRRLVGLNKDVILADRDEKQLKAIHQLCGAPAFKSSAEAAGQADLIIVSVPIGSFEDVIREIAPVIKPGQVVIDITSIKAVPVAIMHKYITKGTVLGAHPLFGPGVTGMEGQNFILTPTDEAESAFAVKVTKFLTDHGASVKIMTPQAHDELLAVVQGLSHFVAIASADALAALGPVKEMKEAATTTFKIFLNYIESVIGDDPELYAMIQMQHPRMPEIYRTLNASVEKWADIVKRKDVNGFTGGMNALKVYLNGGKKGR